MSSLLAFPSTGGDFSFATQLPSDSCARDDSRALGFTLICRTMCGAQTGMYTIVYIWPKAPPASYFLAGWGWARRMEGDRTLSETWKSQTAAPPLSENSTRAFGRSPRLLNVLPARPKPRAMPAKSQ